MTQPENLEFWNNDEFFFVLDLTPDGITSISYYDAVKFILDYRDIEQLGCWRILFRNTLGTWIELKHNGRVFIETAKISETEWVWKLLNAVD